MSSNSTVGSSGFNWIQFCTDKPNTGECLTFCSSNSNLPVCESVSSFYGYRISIVANSLFLAIFSLALIIYVGTYIVTRRGFFFTLAMVYGLVSEIIGYAGRILSWQNQWSENPFFMQLICISLAPAFMAAGIYLCLGRIVTVFGPENSRIPPAWYTRTFIPCDIVSLLLQAAGGGLASAAWNNNGNISQGDDILIAGLSFQVFTLVVFMACSVDFAIHAKRRHLQLGSEAFDQNATTLALRRSWRFKGFLVALGLATICIFWRCAFRVAELSKGWYGPLTNRQDLFIGFEGVMIVVASVALIIFHPSICFKEIMMDQGGWRKLMWWKKKSLPEGTTVESREGKRR